MSDPLQRRGHPPPTPADLPPLWQLAPAPQRSTDRLAADVAARSAGKRYEQIIKLLTERGPLTLFEICAALGKEKNQLSGRMTELRSDHVIEFTGERRTDPKTGCQAEVYRIV